MLKKKNSLSLAISIVAKQGLSSEKFSNQSKHFFKKIIFSHIIEYCKLYYRMFSMNHKSSCKKKKQFRCIGLYEIQISIFRCTFFLTFIGTDQAFEMWSRWDQGKQRNRDPYNVPPPKKKVFCSIKVHVYIHYCM